MQDVLALKIAFLTHSVVQPKESGIFWKQGSLNFGWHPDKELAFFTLTIGILGGVETSLLRGHFAHNVIECLLGDATIEGVVRHQVSMQVDAAEQGIIVEHLLKVRHKPFSIYRVAMKAATKLVVDATV